MPMDRKFYPENWDAIALEIKESVLWKCEECGKQCRRNGESWAEFFSDWDFGSQEFTDATDHPKRFTLTVAHLNHIPQDCDRSNLRALCAPCHLRYDARQMGIKKRLKKERHGQLNLEDLEVSNG